MANASIGTGTAVSTGLTLFGVSTGLDPAILIAGLAGGLWAQSLPDPAPFWRRAPLAFLAAIVSGYFTPLAVAALVYFDFVRQYLPLAIMQLPAAVVIGFWSHKVLGPWLLALGAKKAEETLQ